MLRDKILERLKMQNDIEKILDKIMNKKSITQKEAEAIYTNEQLNELDYQLKQEPILSKEEQEEYDKIAFKEDMELFDRIKELEAKKENKILEIVQKLEKNLSSSTTSQKQTKQETKLNNKIDNYFNKYLEYKKDFYKISDSSIKSYKASYKYFKYFITNNTNLNFSFFKKLQKQLQQLPKNFFKYKKYYTKDFKEVVKLKDIENYDTLDNKTINNHIVNIKNFFDYLVYEEIIEINPLSNIKPLIENKEIKKEEYSEEELQEIFNSDIEKEYLNMCKVALYTGFRIEEVLSIKKENIKDNLIYLDLEDTISKKHKRIMPIHNNIQKIIQNQKKYNKGDFLFFDGNSPAEVKNVGKRLNRRLKKIINNPYKSFHSFRKNFSQELEINTKAEDKIKKYLMGHTLNKDITHTVYNRSKINIDKLFDCISQITFKYK